MGEGVMSALTCGVCCHAICDRYIMRVADASYHERCLQCCICGARLAQTCFTRDAKLYCRLDYDRLYVKKCLGCSERISPEELVMRALDSVFHLRCFVCVVCGARLQKGDQFVIKQGQLFCRPDYEKEVEMLQGYAQGDFTCDDLLPMTRAQDGRRGPKRPRTILTTQQRRAFKASFEVSPKPCRKVREGLAKETGLSVRIVQVWFQNQRAKMKKIQKKARLENNKTPKEDENSNEKVPNTSVKEEEQSPAGTTSGFMNDSCSDTELGSLHAGSVGGVDNYLHTPADQDMDTLRHFQPIKAEIMDHEDSNSFFKNNNNNNNNDDMHQVRAHQQDFASGKMDNGFPSFPYTVSPLESSHHHHHHHLNHHHAMFLQHGSGALGLNPIDRLYSMQTSYFCGEEAALVDQ